MPAQETWELIGFSFIPLILGAGSLFLAIRVTKRLVWRIPTFTLGIVFLAYWLVMVFSAAYPTINQTDNEYKCYDPSGAEIECPPGWFERHRQ
jgi:hypothetical protein